MNMRTIWSIICVAFLLGAIYAPVVKACMICVPYPKTTFADVLNESESVILARERTGKPDIGVEEIEKMYFSNRDSTQDELEEVLKSFSVLGSEGGIRFKPEIVDRRHRILKSYATLLDNYPRMAGLVAKDLTNWKIRALVPQLAKIKKDDEPVLDPSALFTVDYYLSMASKFPAIKGIH